MAILKNCLTALVAVFLFQESFFLFAGSSNPRTSSSRSSSAAQSGSTRTAAKTDRAPEKTADEFDEQDPEQFFGQEEDPQKEKEDDDFFIYLPGDKDKKKETASANAKKEPGEHEKLQGVLYFLVRRTGERKTLIASPGKKDIGGDNVFSVLQRFVLGSWMSSINSKGERYYPELERVFKRKAAPSFSCFYQSGISWGKGAELFDCGDHFVPDDSDIIGRVVTETDQEGAGEKDAGWMAVYSGYVVAPFTGKIRFLGFCDDMMVVRFNRQIVLDYGLRSLTTGLPMESGSGDELRVILGGNSSMKEEKRMINESPLYSRNKLEISFPEYDGHGLARSPVLSIQKGQVIPISILLGEQCRDRFSMILLVERLDSSGKSFSDPSKYIYLFRTTTELPDSPRADSFPDFNPNSPIWKVVDSKGKPIPPKASAKTQDKTK